MPPNLELFSQLYDEPRHRSGHTIVYKNLKENLARHTHDQGRTQQHADSQGKSRKALRQAQSQRLLPHNESSPADAKIISISPGGQMHNSAPMLSNHAQPSRKPAGSKFKFGDSLNASSNRAGHVIGKLAPPQIPPSPKQRRHSWDDLRSQTEEKFDAHERREVKRRKMNTGGMKHVGQQQPVDVDLTKEPSPNGGSSAYFGQPLARSTSHASGSPHRELSGSPSSVTFGSTSRNSYARHTDIYTQMTPDKPKRKPLRGVAASQTPSTASSLRSGGRQKETFTTATSNDQEKLDADVQMLSHVGNIKRRASTPHLSPGVTSRSQGVSNGVEAPADLDMARTKGRAEAGSPNTGRRRLKWEQGRTSRLPTEKIQHETIDPEKGLRHQFKRDSTDEKASPPSIPPQTARPYPVHEMARIPIKESPSSPDALAGETTVPTLSPKKQSDRLINLAAISAIDQSQARRSKKRTIPQEIDASAPENFGQRAKQRGPKASETSPKIADQLVVPIKWIYCRACCVQGEDLNMVWIDSEKSFLIERHHIVKGISTVSKLLIITKSEAKFWIDAGAEGGLDAQLKGSASENTNGQILIGFFSSSDLLACRSKLQTQDINIREVADLTHMAKIISKQKSEVLIDHQRRHDLTSGEGIELGLIQKRLDRSRQLKVKDDDPIKYEVEEVKSGTTAQPHPTALTRSKHFPITVDEPRRSSRQRSASENTGRSRSPAPQRWTHLHDLPPWSHSLVYPPEGSARRVTVDFPDLERLDEGEFLNDSIIGFALRRIEENMASEHKDSVHFFNSFFYETLTQKNGKKGFYYDAVKRWTKNKDLLSKPYIVVPINIDLHWFVAVICNLDNLKRRQIGVDSEAEDAEFRESFEDLALPDAQSSATIKASSDIMDGKMSSPPVGDSGNHNKTQEDSPATQSTNTTKRKGRPVRKYEAELPAVITLDSFGSARSTEVRHLKDYVTAEAETKRGMRVHKQDLQGITVKGIPLQKNFCDCGVYLVAYIEQFAKDPEGFVTKALQRELSEDHDFAEFDPSVKRDEIRAQILTLHEKQDAERRAKQASKKAVNAMGRSKATAVKPTFVVQDMSHNSMHPEKKTTTSHTGESNPAKGTQTILNEDQHMSTQPIRSTVVDEELPMTIPRPLPQSKLESATGRQAVNGAPVPKSTNRASLYALDDSQDSVVLLDQPIMHSNDSTTETPNDIEQVTSFTNIRNDGAASMEAFFNEVNEHADMASEMEWEANEEERGIEVQDSQEAHVR